ncbi:MAG TPA: hypothetical protein PLN21_06020 [Gemmatales bacterium]|nr:hypothetical protein [Gemmatales bacterium]
MFMQQQMMQTIVIVLLTLVGAGVTTQLEAHASLVAISGFVTADQPTVLRDHINFFWVGGGAILGGYVAVALKQISGLHHVVKYFAVSVATAFAVGAWLAWEIVGILAGRLKAAARKRGWIGVKEELLNPAQGDTNKETHL